MAEDLDNDVFDPELEIAMAQAMDESDPDAPRKRKRKLGARKKAPSVAPASTKPDTPTEAVSNLAAAIEADEDLSGDVVTSAVEPRSEQEGADTSTSDLSGAAMGKELTASDNAEDDATSSDAVDDEEETEYLTVEDLDADIAHQEAEAFPDEHEAPRGTKLTKRRRARKNASVEFNLPPSEVSQGMSYFQPANTSRRSEDAEKATPEVASNGIEPEAPLTPQTERPKLRILEPSQSSEPQPSTPIPALSEIVEDVRPRQVTASRRVIERAHMLAARIDTGAPEPLRQARPRKLDKFFSGRSRGYIVESRNRRSLPMVAVARRLGVAAITALAVVAGSLYTIDHAAGQGGQKIASMERLKTQLQDLADASLTREERRQASVTVEVEDLASVLPPKADRAQMAPVVSKRPQARLPIADDPQQEVRPPLI